MLKTLLVIALIILAIIMITVILLQPDKSNGIAKTEHVLDQEKDGIEKFTEIVAVLFLSLAVIYNVIR